MSTEASSEHSEKDLLGRLAEMSGDPSLIDASAGVETAPATDQEASATPEAEAQTETAAVLAAYREFVQKDYSNLPMTQIKDRADTVRSRAIKDDFRALFDKLFSYTEDDALAFTSEDLRTEVGTNTLDLKPAFNMFRNMKFPGTANIPMFQGCGGVLIARRDGTMVAYDESKTGGGVYELMNDTSRYMLFKMAALETLEKLGREPNLEVHADTIGDILDMRLGSVQMGGFMTELPIGSDGAMEKVVVGLCSREITRAALETHLANLTHPKSVDPYPTDAHRESLPDSLKQMPYGFFTGAGYFDYLAGEIVAATLKGATYEECKAIITKKYQAFLALEKRYPAPGRYN